MTAAPKKWTLHQDPYGVMVICHSDRTWCVKNGYGEHFTVVAESDYDAERQAREITQADWKKMYDEREAAEARESALRDEIAEKLEGRHNPDKPGCACYKCIESLLLSYRADQDYKGRAEKAEAEIAAMQKKYAALDAAVTDWVNGRGIDLWTIDRSTPEAKVAEALAAVGVAEALAAPAPPRSGLPGEAEGGSWDSEGVPIVSTVGEGAEPSAFPANPTGAATGSVALPVPPPVPLPSPPVEVSDLLERAIAAEKRVEELEALLAKIRRKSKARRMQERWNERQNIASPPAGGTGEK